jgi:antitoxin PrlF
MHSHYFCNVVDPKGLEVTMAETLAPCPQSTLTDRYQTTVPEPIRKALGLSKRDKICYAIQPDGKVLISRVDQTENDPILERFLNFLTQDIENHPQDLQAISVNSVSCAQSLVLGADLDLDAPLLDEDE